MILFLFFNSQKGHLQGVSPRRLHNEKNNPELLLTHHPSNCKYKKSELLMATAVFKLVVMLRKMSTKLYLLYSTGEGRVFLTNTFQKINKII